MLLGATELFWFSFKLASQSTKILMLPRLHLRGGGGDPTEMAAAERAASLMLSGGFSSDGMNEYLQQTAPAMAEDGPQFLVAAKNDTLKIGIAIICRRRDADAAREAADVLARLLNSVAKSRLRPRAEAAAGRK